MPGGGQLVGELRQISRRKFKALLCSSACLYWVFSYAQKCPQSRQTHGVEGAQGHLVAWQRCQFIGHVSQGLAAQGFNGVGGCVIGLAGVEHAVDGQTLVAQAQQPQLGGCAGRLLHGARVGPGDQHHGGERRVAQRSQRGVEAGCLHLQARVRPQARCASVVVGQKTTPRLGQAQQAQCVAGGRGVEHHVVVGGLCCRVGVVGQQRGKFVKRRNFGGARARQLLAHGAAFGRQLRQHALSVGLCGSIRVDVQHLQARHTGHVHGLVAEHYAQHVVEVGRRVGADQQHPPARVGQRNGRGGGQRRFAHPALAREKQEAGGYSGKAGQCGGVHAGGVPGGRCWGEVTPMDT